MRRRRLQHALLDLQRVDGRRAGRGGLGIFLGQRLVQLRAVRRQNISQPRLAGPIPRLRVVAVHVQDFSLDISSQRRRITVSRR